MTNKHFSASAMREAIGSLPRLLSKADVTVTQSGSNAYVENDANGKPIRVNIPSIPDGASDAFLAAIQGFIDHEVAHILHTDFTVLSRHFILPKTATKKERHLSNALFSLLNIIEDARIEKAMREVFKGSKGNLHRVGRFFLENFTEPKLKEAEASGDKKLIESVIIVPGIRAFAGQETFLEWMDEEDRWEMLEFFTEKVKQSTLDKIKDCQSTEDAYELAKEMIKELYEEPPEEEEEEEEEGSEDDESGGSTGGSGRGGISNDEDEAEKSESDEAEKSESDEGDEEDEGATSGKSEEDALDALADAKGFDEAVGDAIGDLAVTEQSMADYIPYTTDYDFNGVHEISDSFKISKLESMIEETASMTGELQRRLERMMITRTKSRYQPGLRTGKLHSANIARLRVGDGRVFRKKISHKESKDVSVSLVIDCSGSMSCGEIDIAMTAALAMGSVLDRLSINCEISGFTTKNFPTRSAQRSAEDEFSGGKVSYDRLGPISNSIFKKFEETMSVTAKKRMADVLCGSFDMNCNVDGESVQIAATRLLGQRTSRRVMIVLSDGQPSGTWGGKNESEHLKYVVDKCTKSGIEMIGIGIVSSAVEEYYPKNVVMRNISDLPKGVMHELSKALGL